jgi:hypothetical protein
MVLKGVESVWTGAGIRCLHATDTLDSAWMEKDSAAIVASVAVIPAKPIPADRNLSCLVC